jgi:alkylation response protein AidB-like acyl-CoA dehydrogenase
MDLRPSPEDDAFRAEVRAYVTGLFEGEFAHLRGVGGPGSEHELIEDRLALERRLGGDGWAGLAFPVEHGGRGASVMQQVIWFEEYVRAGGPGRAGIVGEGLVGPTLIHFGTPEQQQRFLPGIVKGTELWCQGYSEPEAGSDLANLKTKAVRDGDEWVITGQKVWTSLAHFSDWVFVLCRTNPDAPRHKGISYLLCPMDQPGIEVRPIEQLTGTSEFNEVFFDGARTPVANTIGEVDGGWRVAMGTLAFERGASTFGQQMAFERELQRITDHARENGKAADPVWRQRLADAWIRLRILRFNAMRTLARSDLEAGPEMAISKLYWASFHRDLGELAVDVLGADATIGVGLASDPYDLTVDQREFLFTRSDTIYGGSNQIQRNVIGERTLGLPPEPKAV